MRLSIVGLAVLLACNLLPACNDGAADSAASLSQSSQPTTLSAGESAGAETADGSGSGGPEPTGEAPGTTGAGGETSSADTSTGPSTSVTTGATTGELPPAIVCTYPSTSFAAAPKELMVPKGSGEQLSFTVPGLPDPASVVTATLRFVSYDSDHTGAEGVIRVNGGAEIDLPADPAWENAEHATVVPVTGMTLTGDNTIAFGAGSFVDGTFYRIGQVALEIEAEVGACPEAPPQPPKAVQLDYNDAVYTKRHNWVLRCDFQDGYAFTAKGDQAQLDCGALYDPDGTRTGTATFTFVDLAPATYEITIRARHSANRNPKGALFVVDGEAKRVDQTVGEDIVTDIWGTKALAGTIEVVLDSDMEPESDSVTWVRLEPL